MDAFYSNSILTHQEVKGDRDTVFVSVWSVNVSWENIWDYAEVIGLCVRIFHKLIKYHPQSFGQFCLTENKDEQLWFVVYDIIYKLNLIFYWTSAW